MTDEEIANKMTVHEKDVLRIACGEDVPGWTWGAAMSVCMEWLQEHGLLDLNGKPTATGLRVRAILEAQDAKEKTDG